MQIQSLSICVPIGCFNKCKFCVSRIHPNRVPNLMEEEFEFYDLHHEDYKNCMEFARDNGCNTLMFTGDGEPLMNRKFMGMVADINATLTSPFRWIEVQTAGYKLQNVVNGRNAYMRWLRNTIRVKIISLSLSSVFSSEDNAFYNATTPTQVIDIDKTCSEIKRFDFTLRLSLNMTDFYNNKSPAEIFARVKELGANQITFRKLYKSSDGNDVTNQFIEEHSCSPTVFDDIQEYVIRHGRELERLPFGAMKYSVDEISTVVDNDCMSTESKNDLKYLILRQNCKLYSKWDDLGSVLF